MKISYILGHGIFATKSFEKGDFLLQYKGNIVSADVGEQLQEKYENENLGCFLYFFAHEKKDLW